MSKEKKRAMNVELPADLWQMFSKLCIDSQVSKTEAIIQYLKYLKAQNNKCRRLLNEGSEDNFKLHE